MPIKRGYFSVTLGLSALIINRVGNVCMATQPTRPRILSLQKKKKRKELQKQIRNTAAGRGLERKHLENEGREGAGAGAGAWRNRYARGWRTEKA